MDNKLPITCPSCTAKLKVTSLQCASCKTTINGEFELPVLLQLNQQEINFVIDFVKSSGSLKVMAKNLNFSYPTVRNMLDELIDKIDNLQNQQL